MQHGVHHVPLLVQTPDPPSPFMVGGGYPHLPSTGHTTCVPRVQPALVKVMNDPPKVVKLTSSADTQLTADMVGTNHAAPPPPPEPPPTNHHVAHWWQDLVYNIPTPKVHKCRQYLFPSGSMVDFATLDCAPSPTTPFEFPVNPVTEQYYEDLIADLPDIPTMRDSVTRVTSQPWVCELVDNAHSTIQVMLLAAHQGISSMVDGGANICLTNILSLYSLMSWISPCSPYQWWLWVPMSKWFNVVLNVVSFCSC
jgi:hypothetical protein